MHNNREPLWIAMSDLWLDQDLTDDSLKYIAKVVRESGLSEAELDQVFLYELAPFLGFNHLTVTGVWAGFDPDWVCEQARIRQTKYRWRDRMCSFIGLTTYAAKPDWQKVKALVFDVHNS